MTLQRLICGCALAWLSLAASPVVQGSGWPYGTGPLADSLASIGEAELREHVVYLTSPALAGRGSCQGGGDVAAAAHLAEEFRSAGLEAAGEGGFLQPFDCPAGGHSYNVLGAIPGSDARVSAQTILVGAHYDHLGQDARGYFPGADDNASGVAAVLEVAEALMRLERPPRRRIVFAAFGAEERSRLGSRHLASRWLPALAVNLDMVGHKRTGGLRVYGGAQTPALRQLLLAVCARNSSELPLLSEAAGSGSDHEPYVEAGVPTLFFHTGLHLLYHSREDRAHTLDYPGLRSVSRILFELVYELSESENMPVLSSAPPTRGAAH